MLIFSISAVYSISYNALISIDIIRKSKVINQGQTINCRPQKYSIQKNLSLFLPSNQIINTISFFYILATPTSIKLRSVQCRDSNHLLGQRWHFLGSFVGPTSTNDVSPVSFCSLGKRNYQPLVRCWSNARSPTSPAYANVMPTILFQVSRQTNVCPT